MNRTIEISGKIAAQCEASYMFGAICIDYRIDKIS